MDRSSDQILSRPLITGGTLILAALIVLTGCTRSEEQGTGSDQGPSGTSVRTTTVESETLEETLTAVGSLRADQTVRISPEIAGPITKITFNEGETVAKGEVLVEIEDATLREQLQARIHSLEQARAQLKNARRTYERNTRLHSKDMIPAQQLDNSEEAYQSAKAQVEQLKSQVQEARERLQNATIKAPFTGLIGSREVDAGNYVQPGTHLSTLYRLDPLDVRFTLPERFTGRVRTGQSVRVHVTAYPDTSFPAEVYFVSPSVREQTRDFLVKARVQNPDRTLKPGAFARVQLTLDTLKDRPVVPSEALIGTTEGYILFTVEDGEAQRQPVKIGLRKPGRVEIREGVVPGQTIVQSGHQDLTDGSPVEIVNEQE